MHHKRSFYALTVARLNPSFCFSMYYICPCPETSTPNGKYHIVCRSQADYIAYRKGTTGDSDETAQSHRAFDVSAHDVGLEAFFLTLGTVKNLPNIHDDSIALLKSITQ